MKSLLLLRHAKAQEKVKGVDDSDRQLLSEGWDDASALGNVMKTRNLVPNHIVCSSAQRTQETCTAVLEGLGHRICYEVSSTLYNGEDSLLNELQQFPLKENTGLTQSK